jgi:hypothetical protein
VPRRLTLFKTFLSSKILRCFRTVLRHSPVSWLMVAREGYGHGRNEPIESSIAFEAGARSEHFVIQGVKAVNCCN